MTLRSPLVAVWVDRHPVPDLPRATPESPLGLLGAYLSQGPSVGPLWDRIGRLLQPLIDFLAQQPEVDRLGEQSGRADFTCGSISNPLISGMLMSERIRIRNGSGIALARSSASGADAANSMMKRSERMSRRNCWRNRCSTSGSSSTTRM